MRGLSKKQTIIVVLIVPIIGLLLYANSIAFSLITAPSFYMYAAVVAAVALTIMTLTLFFTEKRKLMFPKHLNIPVQTTTSAGVGLNTPKKMSQVLLKVQPLIITKEKTKIFESAVEERSYLSAKQPTPQPDKQPTPQTITPSNVEKTPLIQLECAIEEKEGKLNCLKCKKEFSQPILMMDYSTNQPELIGHCPYCDETIDLKQKKISETEAEKVEQKNQPNSLEQTVDKTKMHPEALHTGKLACSSCHKEFSQPILMADYSKPNQPELIGHCPYCFQPLDSKINGVVEEESLKKYV
jgi:hypothetical protein